MEVEPRAALPLGRARHWCAFACGHLGELAEAIQRGRQGKFRGGGEGRGVEGAGGGGNGKTDGRCGVGWKMYGRWMANSWKLDGHLLFWGRGNAASLLLDLFARHLQSTCWPWSQPTQSRVLGGPFSKQGLDSG